MTDSNTGLINNTAEISKAHNDLELLDIDSIDGNNQKEEDDLGSAEVIISIKTGGVISYILLIMTSIIILIGIGYLINIKVLRNIHR